MLTFIYDDFFGSIGLNLLMWSEFGRSWPFWPMRGLGIQRTHAFSRHVSSGAKKHLISSHTLIVNTCFPLHYVGHTWQVVATKWCYGVHLQFEVIEVLFGSVFFLLSIFYWSNVCCISEPMIKILSKIVLKIGPPSIQVYDHREVHICWFFSWNQ